MGLTSSLVTRVPPFTGLSDVLTRWLGLFVIKHNAQRVLHGTGSPLNVVVEDIGALYLRDDGGAGSTLYIKEADSGLKTGWRAV